MKLLEFQQNQHHHQKVDVKMTQPEDCKEYFSLYDSEPHCIEMNDNESDPTNDQYDPEALQSATDIIDNEEDGNNVRNDISDQNCENNYNSSAICNEEFVTKRFRDCKNGARNGTSSQQLSLRAGNHPTRPHNSAVKTRRRELNKLAEEQTPEHGVFRCQLCDKTYSKRDSLKTHMISHPKSS